MFKKQTSNPTYYPEVESYKLQFFVLVGRNVLLLV